ncbi:VOC family protein [Oribacterium sp. WCC10]|uniref:VOC family protein n=1 Tax=Oribacterium sp. WCC10 TaxID=1855343 RepID=UPI0008EB13DF|nr:VOC family protein [Oribacterium sp. WCC10]SFG20269.1 2-dehydro-3-deoxyphosphogluconate aldolase / (4S)-4-hydroxy-2-oxoglutarate aldolase [Oribacterium sp. WCC10]
MADEMSMDFDAVKELGLCVLHVGINADGEEDALRIANEFQTLMGFLPRVGNSSIFSSDLIEIMKKDGPGEKGHIAIGTHDVAKAAAFFEKRGMGLKKETAKYNEDGSMMFIYLDKMIAGFAIHLKQY